MDSGRLRAPIVASDDRAADTAQIKLGSPVRVMHQAYCVVAPSLSLTLTPVQVPVFRSITGCTTSAYSVTAVDVIKKKNT
jgi:hypothetical protein